MDVSDLLTQEEILQLISLKEIFGGFAHEIAQPLNAIMIASQVIQLRVQRSLLSEDEKSFLVHRLGIVSSQVQRATQIVETLRGFSQPRTSDSVHKYIKASFEKVFSLMGQQFVGRGVELAWECDDFLPPLTTEPHLAELVLVQGLAFARSSVEIIGEWHDEKGVSYTRVVQVKLAPEDARSTVQITWSGGQFPEQEHPIEPSAHAGLATAASILGALGGDLRTSANTISISFV
jgi:nitrogen-specific signal transduction histidine kinase